jgi:Transmembrane secretion effector
VRLTSVPFLALWAHRDFRCLGLSVFFHTLSMVGEQVVLGWFILELTNSALMVGVGLGLRNLPLLLIGIPAGVVADRGDRVRLLQVSGIVMTVITATLGLLVALRIDSVWPVLTLTFITGCARALHQTARQSYAHDIAGADGLVHALALVALTSRVGGLIGSLLTGFLIARHGTAVAYLAVAAGYLGSALVMLPARSNGRPSTDAGSLGADVFDFLTTIRRDRVLLHLMSLTAVAEVLGFSHQALLPSLARDVLQVGPGGLGVMTAARQVGGLIGITVTSGLAAAHGLGPLFLIVLVAFGASLVSLSLAGSFVVVVLILVGTNAMGAVTDVLAQTLIQLAVPSGRRGRAGGAWVVAIGMAPLGQFQIGALATLFGVAAALSVNGLALMAVAGAAALLVPKLRKL